MFELLALLNSSFEIPLYHITLIVQLFLPLQESLPAIVGRTNYEEEKGKLERREI